MQSPSTYAPDPTRKVHVAYVIDVETCSNNDNNVRVVEIGAVEILDKASTRYEFSSIHIQENVIKEVHIAKEVISMNITPCITLWSHLC